MALTVENSQICSIFRVTVPPIYSQFFLGFPKYRCRKFSVVSVDKTVDEFRRFSPQAVKAWEQWQTAHPEGGGDENPDVGAFGFCPQYPQSLLLLLNP